MSLIPTVDLLDLNGIGQRQATFLWEILDDGLTHQGYLGVLSPPDTAAPVVVNDSAQLIQRTLNGFELPTNDGIDFEEARARIRPWLVMADGAKEPVGTFLFVDARRIRSTYGIEFQGTLGDLGVLVNQQSAESIAYPVGTLIESVIAQLLEQQGVLYYLIDATGIRLSAPVAWAAGTSVKQVVDELAGLMGCTPLYFEADGRARIRLVPDPTIDPIDVTYRSGLNIYDNGIADWNTLLQAPNFFKVIESGTPDANIVGTYAVPDSAPNSEFNLDRRVSDVSNEQGMASLFVANELARLRAISHGTVVSNLAFDGAPDWRHGTYSVLEVLGARYLERRWSMTCEEGAPMAHECSKVYE